VGSQTVLVKPGTSWAMSSRLGGKPAANSLKFLLVFIIIILVTILSCVPSNREQQLFPLMDSDAHGPTRACIQLEELDGPVPEAKLPRSAAEDEAIRALQIEAKGRGGNFVLVDRVTWSQAGTRGWRGSAHGIAFSCSWQKMEPPTHRVCENEGGLTTCSLVHESGPAR
jgi:hypothetical protein